MNTRINFKLRNLFFLAVAGACLGTGVTWAGNPVIWGDASSHVHYDPFNDTTVIHNDRLRYRESSLDPNRTVVDPGSYKYVNRYVRDQWGSLWREFGPTWTSYGVAHGKLTRERIRHYPGWHPGGGVHVHDSDSVVYMQPGGSGGVVQHDSDKVVYSKIPSGGKKPGVGGTANTRPFNFKKPGFKFGN